MRHAAFYGVMSVETAQVSWVPRPYYPLSGKTAEGV